MTNLGSLGGPQSSGNGINDSGQVVGYSTTSKIVSNATTHGFVYTSGRMVDLNATLSAAQARQYVINVAQAINNVGVILANGTDVATGDQAIFLLTETAVAPPPPVPPSFDKTSVSFNGQGVNTTSSPQTITMTNPDVKALTITSIANVGGSATQFPVANNCGASLAPSASCQITAKFRPGGSGDRFTELTVTDSAGKQTISLTGIGVTSPFEVMQTELEFLNQAVGTQSAAKTVQVVNASDAAVPIMNIVNSGGSATAFPFTTNCGSSVPAREVCTIDVSFRPGGLGNRYTTLMIDDGAGTQTVNLSGPGIAEPIQLSTNALSFASQGVGTISTPQQVTITNSGTQAVFISSIANVGGSSTGFLLSNDCGSQINPQDSCVINVSFRPGGVGNRKTTLTLTDNQGTRQVSLSGTGVAE